MISRRKLIAAIPALATVPVYGHFVEPRWIDVVTRTVRIPKLHAPVRILHLSDLHVSDWVPLSIVQTAIQTGLAVRPDLICLTGDFITDLQPVDAGAYAAALRRLREAAPVFACLGNHDGGSWSAARDGYPQSAFIRGVLERGGARLLHNEGVHLETRGGPLALVGTGDLWSGECLPSLAFQGADASLPTVYLAHNPDSKDVAAMFPWHLMLSGHTHGGQIMLPGLGSAHIPVRDKRFIAGLYAWGERQIYVTRGVGSIFGIRINCRPEVTILNLEPADG